VSNRSKAALVFVSRRFRDGALFLGCQIVSEPRCRSPN
jgi:hypothetical protein